jgi:hypothetical protein
VTEFKDLKLSLCAANVFSCLALVYDSMKGMEHSVILRPQTKSNWLVILKFRIVLLEIAWFWTVSPACFDSYDTSTRLKFFLCCYWWTQSSAFADSVIPVSRQGPTWARSPTFKVNIYISAEFHFLGYCLKDLIFDLLLVLLTSFLIHLHHFDLLSVSFEHIKSNHCLVITQLRL